MVLLPKGKVEDLVSGKYCLVSVLIPHINTLHVEVIANALTAPHSKQKSAPHLDQHLLLCLLTSNYCHFGLPKLDHLLLQAEVSVHRSSPVPDNDVLVLGAGFWQMLGQFGHLDLCPVKHRRLLLHHIF